MLMLLLALACAPENSCEAYIDAKIACASVSGADTTSFDANQVCGEWTEDDETVYGAWYTCQATAYEEADCSTAEGLDAAATAAAACPQ